MKAKAIALRTTLKKVNAALEAKGHVGIELIKGNGYWYFAGGKTASFFTNSVLTYRLNSLTVEGWVEEYERMLERHKNAF